jgi:hypothetical protein
MRVLLGIALLLATIGNAPPVWAGDFDGSKLLICATTQAMECVAGEDCSMGSAADIGAPRFMRIDFAQKSVIGPKRTSTAHFAEASGAQLLLQGTELGFGWSIAVDQEDGSMSGTLVDREGAFILFGICTPG